MAFVSEATAHSALASANPIPSPPIGSSAAVALPTGAIPAGQIFRTENRGSGAASQAPICRALFKRPARIRFSVVISAKARLDFPDAGADARPVR